MQSEANGVILQFFHSYIAPDGSLWKELESSAQELANAGFTAIWLPPAYKAAGGASDLGYAVYDMYDLGEFDQRGSVRTKYGTKDQLLDAVSTARNKGLHIYWDVVFNHRMGSDHEEEVLATPFSESDRRAQIGEPRKIKAHTHFSFPGRKQKYSAMEWHWWHFTAVDVDINDPEFDGVFLLEGKEFDVNVDQEKGSFDYLMGCDVDVKHPEVQEEIKRWGDWFNETVGMDGVRFDAVKHVEAGFFAEWLQHVRTHAQKSIFAVGEYWSFDVEALHAFISATGGDVALFDAPLQRNFSDASKAGASFDMRKIFDHSLVKNEPTLAVTIVGNHDTQPLQSLESVVEEWFKPLAYALILLRKDGYPCVFYADYYGAQYKDEGDDGMEHSIEMISHREQIDKFLAVRRRYAFGDQHDYFDHERCIGWSRVGDDEHPGGIAVLMSNGDDGLKAMQTSVGNQIYHDVTGAVPETVQTNEEGWGDFRCKGGSVSVWVPVTPEEEK